MDEVLYSDKNDNRLYLTNEEARVLASLIEKQLTTPDYYPMTLNSLVAACNQLTNRKPVVSYTEEQVEETLKNLREKKLSTRGVYPGSRVPKHKQSLDTELNLQLNETSILATLMLRGNQTLAEIKQTTARMYDWESLDEVNETVNILENKKLIQTMPREPGQKEQRIKQVITNNQSNDEIIDGSYVEEKDFKEDGSNKDLLKRLEDLEKRVTELEEKI